MPNLTVKKDFLEAGIVKDIKVWCFGKDPIVSPQQVKFAAGASKFSICAAFSFTSTKNKKFPTFKLVFCAKLHSKIFRRDPSNRSSWFIWQPIGKSGCIVLNSDKCEEEYGFDVYKFVKTPEFISMQSTFKKTILKGIAAAKALRKDVPQEELQQYETYIKSLEEAADIVALAPDINEDSFKLIDFDKFRRELEKQGYGDELRNRAETMTQAHRDIGVRFVDKVKKNALKAGEQEKQDRIEDKRRGDGKL